VTGHGTSPRSALPAHIVDRIRDGVPPADLRAAGDRAVYRALVSTASSAVQRGWIYAQWAAFVSEPRSALGRQARTRGGRKERTPRDYERTLTNAWDAAGKWLATAAPPLTPREITERITAVRAFIADADAQLDDTERAVVAYACNAAAEYGTDRPALPRHRVVAGTGLGEKAVRNALDRLDDRGVLIRVSRGKAGNPAKGKGKAALYRLPTAEALRSPYLYRGTRSVGPSARSMGPSAPAKLAPVEVYRPLRANGRAELTLTVRAADPQRLAAVADALRSDPALAVETERPTAADRRQLP